MSAWPSYSLTTWEQPIEEMIDSTVKLLFEEINNQNVQPQTIMMKGHIVIRKSVKEKSA